MYIERLEDLSVYYFLSGLFAGTTVGVVEGFPETELVPPVVAYDSVNIELLEYELGNREGLRNRSWDIDIFALNKSQRDEIGYKILNELKNGITVYNYDEGFPPNVTPSVISHLGILARKMRVIRIIPELVEKMYYRATITVVAINDVV